MKDAPPTADVPWLLQLPGLRRFAALLAKAVRQRNHSEKKVAKLRQRIRAARAAFARQNRAHKARQLSSDALLAMMRPRLDALLESNAAGAAKAREAAFLGRSESYAEAVSSDSPVRSRETGVEIGGLLWYVPERSGETDGLAGRMVARQWLPLERILATREVASGGTMLDIGANIGTTSIPRVVLGDFSKVYAAEPEPLNYACLVDNVRANGLEGFVLPDRTAIGRSDGDVRLRRSPRIGSHRLVRTAASPADLTVPSRRLDSWVTHLDVDVKALTFVKVDTQGWETHVLSGAPDLITQRHIAWQIEFSPRLLERAGSSPAELVSLIEQRFESFIDLSALNTPRVKPTTALAEALAYVERRERRYTDLLLF